MLRLAFLFLLAVISNLDPAASLAAEQVQPPTFSLSALDIKVDYYEKSEAEQFVIVGEATFETPDHSEPLCVYVPLADSNFSPNLVATQYLKLAAPLDDSNLNNTTRIDVNPTSPDQKFDNVESGVYRFRPVSPQTKFTFTARFPKSQHKNISNVFFDGFHPIPLSRCVDSAKGKSPIYLAQKSTLKSLNIRAPDQFKVVTPYLAPGNLTEENPDFNRIGFALLQGYRDYTFKVQDVTITVHYTSDDFEELFDTIRNGMVVMQRMFGRFPYPTLHVVESTQLESAEIPGIVTINKPQQIVFDKFQKGVLNWRHWAAINLLALQWYGAAIKIGNENDQWLTKAIVDYATYQTLFQIPKRYDLFNYLTVDSLTLSLNYSEAEHLAAALLNKQDRNAQILNEDLTAHDSFVNQHPYLYVKGSLSLRHAAAYADTAKFRGFLRQFTQRNMFGSFTPKSFLQDVERLPSPLSPLIKQDVAQILKEWWTKPGWPDFAYEKIESEKLPDGRWLNKVKIKQTNKMHVPAFVRLTDELGFSSNMWTPWKENQSEDIELSFVTSGEGKDLEIDPDRDFYDENRLNNRNKIPSLNFFPGSATTLRDDGYTLFYLLYPFRRPGENLSIGMFSALFRHVDRSLLFRFEKELSSGRTGYSLFQDTKIAPLSLNVELSAVQTYDKYRTISLALLKNPFIEKWNSLSGGFVLRHKRIDDVAGSDHFTYSFNTQYQTQNEQSFCNALLKGEYEASFKDPTVDFSYERSKGLFQGSCKATSTVEGVLRLFRGKVRFEGEVPDNAFFDPENLEEARLRLDVNELALSSDIFAQGLDLFLPLAVPLPSQMLILNRNVRFRLFYDQGQALDLHQRYRGAGFGFVLPFGGEFSGSGSLQITRVNFFTILYSSVNDEVDRRPRILFDLTGEY